MLEERQISKLVEICSGWVESLSVGVGSFEQGETSFTANVLLPWLTSNVATLNKPGLYVRGDGGPSIRPLIFHGISLYPDLAIVEGQETYVAFEIKVLTNSDAGGSLTKAIGQTAIYSQLGYKYSFGLIFDARKPSESLLHSKVILSESNFRVSIFS